MAIKRRPEDFVVTEVIDPTWVQAASSRPGPYALYQLTKVGLTTHEAIDALSRRLRIDVDDISAAGLKDKQAITTQHVTIRVDAHSRLPPERLHTQALDAKRLGYVAGAIDSRAIVCNRFRIVLRRLGREAITTLREATQRLADPMSPGALVITNYFGNQRFGSARAGEGFIAAHLVRGDFESALRLAIATPHRKDLHRVKRFKQIVADHWGHCDWRMVLGTLPALPERAAIERLASRPEDYRGAFAALPYFFQQLAVEAYQSLLWNRVATHLLIDRLGGSGRLWVVDDRFGQLVFPEFRTIEPDLRQIEVPLLGRKTELREPWRAAAEHVLAEEGLRDVEMRIPGLERPWFAEVPRRLFMLAEDFSIGPAARDESEADASFSKVELRFTLPRGGYATVLLRALGH